MPYSARQLNQGRMWQWFKSIMGPGEVTDFYNMLKGTTLTDLDNYWNDYTTPGVAIGRGVSAPDLAELRDGLFTTAFDSNNREIGYFTIHILHDISPVPDEFPSFHVHWTHNSATATAGPDTVKWGVDYAYAQGYDVGTYTAPTSVTFVDTCNAQYVHHITSDDDMQMTFQPEPDSVILGRIFRDATATDDTFAADAYLLQIDMHYQGDRVGSVARNNFDESYATAT